MRRVKKQKDTDSMASVLNMSCRIMVSILSRQIFDFKQFEYIQMARSDERLAIYNLIMFQTERLVQSILCIIIYSVSYPVKY